jgi:EmrB/QacA subfamily drug resistance transporter
MAFSGDRRMKVATLLTMCFALFMVMLDNTVVNVALPALQGDLGSRVSGLQWIVNAYTLLFASLMLTGGTLGDLYGRKRVFQGGLLLFAVGSALCGLAPNVEMLVLSRAVQGVGAAALLPGTLAILTNTFPDARERAQAIGIWAGVSALALAAGPVVGGLLVDSLGWQSVFFLNVPIGVVAFMVASRVVRESVRPGGRRIDLPGQALGILGLGALTYALIEGNDKGWRSPLIVSLLAVAVLGLVWFLSVERRRDDPMLKLEFFRNPTFSASVAVAGIAVFGMFAVLFFLSLYFQEIHGYSAVQAGLRFLPMTGAIILTAPSAGRLAGRIGSRIPMTVGMVLAGTGVLLLTRLQPDTGYTVIWWNLTMMGVGMGLTMTPMTAAVMGSVPADRAGMASAVANTTREVGGVFGVALMGAIVTSRSQSLLSTSLSRLGATAGERSRIVAAAARGQIGGRGIATGSVDPEAVRRAVGHAFVGGLHAAMVVAGLALFGAAAVALTFVRGRSAEVITEVPAVEAAAA